MANPSKVWLRLLVSGLFLLSGVAGLVYEILWSRRLALVFGTTLPAVTAVLSAFMGGLGLGSLIFGSLADRWKRPLFLYGLLEIGVGLYAFAFEPLARLVERYALPLASWMGDSGWGLSVTRFFLCLLILGPPTILMGGTLPVLTRALSGRLEVLGRRLGLLYGANTIGAVLGTVLAGFLMIRFLGLHLSMMLAGGLNLLVGVVAVALGLGLPAARKSETGAEKSGGAGLNGKRFFILAAYGFCGFAALACQVSWTRVLVLVLGTSVYAFTTMLATFLLGLALGGAAAGRWIDGRPRLLELFGVIEVGIGFSVFVSIALLGRLPVLFLSLFEQVSGGGFELFQGAIFLLAGLVIFLPTFLMGAAFPVASRIFVGEQSRIGRDVGRLYWWNTCGAIFGSALAGFVFIPAFGTRNTLEGAALLFAAIGLVALNLEPAEGRGKRIGLTPILVLFLAILHFGIAPWQETLLSSGVYVYAPQMEDGFQSNQKFLMYREGIHSLVAVTEQAGVRSLRINGKTDGSDGGDMTTQVLLAQLPLLLHPAPKRALIIGLGTGVTAGSAARHPNVDVECLEIDPEVIRASGFFSHVNGNVLENPRVRVRQVDARTWLARPGPSYDVIISEPSNPWITGVSNLFTREHFEAGRRRLSGLGFFCQWVHSYYMSPDNLRTILRTFVEVFPHSSLWEASTGDYLILGRSGPFDPNVIKKALLQGWQEQGVRDDLSRIGIQEPQDLLARQILTPSELREFIKGGEINTDDRPVVEFLSPLSMYRETYLPNLREIMRFAHRRTARDAQRPQDEPAREARP